QSSAGIEFPFGLQPSSTPEAAMIRTFVVIALGAAISLGAISLAQDHKHGKVKVTVLSERDVVEKVDNKDAKVTTIEVTMEPGQSSPPHRHPGPVFGYILEGDYEWGLNDQPIKTLKVGDTFYEPTGSLHRVSRNPSNKTR